MGLCDIVSATAVKCKPPQHFALQTLIQRPSPATPRTFNTGFTWTHFRWAMSVVMTRQNRLPPVARGVMAPPWPSGVPRYGAAEQVHLALIPLYDMVNHTPGEITSFFTQDERIALEALEPVAPGREVRMSYGSRSTDALLQYQGFVPRDDEQTAQGSPDRTDVTVVEVRLTDVMRGAGILPGAKSKLQPRPEFTQLPCTPQLAAEADALSSDALFRLRVNVLTSLIITPDHSATAYLRRPAADERLRAAAVALTAREQGPEAAAAAEARLRWALPFSFLVRPRRLDSGGGVSSDLRSFLRVACVNDKVEAATALKEAAAARKRFADALAAREQAAAARKDEESDETESGSGDSDNGSELPQLAVGVISPRNEKAAVGALVRILGTAAADLRRDGEGASLPDGAPVVRYRQLLIRYISDAQRDAEDELSALVATTAATADSGAAVALA